MNLNTKRGNYESIAPTFMVDSNTGCVTIDTTAKEPTYVENITPITVGCDTSVSTDYIVTIPYANTSISVSHDKDKEIDELKEEVKRLNKTISDMNSKDAQVNEKGEIVW